MNRKQQLEQKEILLLRDSNEKKEIEFEVKHLSRLSLKQRFSLMTEKTKELKNPLLHYPHPTITEFLREINQYTSLIIQERERKFSSWQILCYPLFKFIQNYFTATPTRIGGIGLSSVSAEQLMRHEWAFDLDCENSDLLDEGGFYSWRENGELHQWNPNTISLLQHAVRLGDYNKYKEYLNAILNNEKECVSIRSLLKFKQRTSIPLEEVEPASEITLQLVACCCG